MAKLTPKTWDMMVAVNLTGAFNCTHAVLPRMREAGGGLLVYISSIAVHLPDQSGAAYQASKHGLSGLAHATPSGSSGARSGSCLRRGARRSTCGWTAAHGTQAGMRRGDCAVRRTCLRA